MNIQKIKRSVKIRQTKGGLQLEGCKFVAFVVSKDILQPLFQAENLNVNTAQKMNFSIRDFFSKCDQIRTEEILSGKLHFLCSVNNF